MLRRVAKYTLSILVLLCSITAKAQVTAGFSANNLAGCPPLHVTFTDQSTGSGITTRNWSFGNGATSNTNNTAPSTVYTTPGTYTVTLTVSNATSTDVETKTAYITVHQLPSVSFSGTPLTGCPPLTVNFTNSTTNNAPGGATYTWYTGAGTSTLQNPSQVYTTPGNKTVTLTVKNSNNCVASLTKTNYINVLAPPSVNFSATQTDFCSAPATANFTSNVSGGVSPYTYFWNFGNTPPGTSTNANPSFTYTAASPVTYDVKLVVTGNNGCKDSLTKSDFIKFHKPTANFTMASQACVNTSVSFTNTSTPTPSSSVWYFGDPANTTATATSPSFTYTTPGTYTVKLVSTTSGCSDTMAKTITILPGPTFDFYKVPDTLCPAPQTVQFFPTSSTSTLVSYAWDLGDGPSSQSTATTPTHTYTQNGTYTVRLVATDNFGCFDTLIKPLFVKLYDLEARISPYEDSGCVPLTVKFKSFVETDSGTNYPYPISSYDWDFGDGNTSTSKNPNHTYTDTGIFEAILKVTTIQGCVVYDTVTIRVGNKPNVGFYATPTIACVREAISFINTSTGPVTGWYWDFGDNTNTKVRNPQKQYFSADTFSVTLRAFHHGCMDSLYREDYIIIKPSAANFDVRFSCDTPLKVRFRNLTEDASWHQFFFGDGNSSLLDSPTHIYSSLGMYNPMLVVYNNVTGCRDTISQSINLTDLTVDMSANDTAVCLGDTVYFSPQVTGGTAINYFWYVDGVLKQTLFPDYKHKFLDTGFHTIKLEIVNNNGCVDSIVKHNYILVSQPVANFGSLQQKGCVPFEVFFKDSSYTTQGAYITNRTWSLGTTSINTTVDTLRYTYNTRGSYDVKVVVTDNVGCKDSMTRVEYIHPHKPTATYNSSTRICLGDTVEFFNFSINSINAWWDFGDGDTIINHQPKHIYQQKGSYTPTLVVTDSLGCKDTIVGMSIDVLKPTASFTVSDSVAVCPPLVAQFNNTSNGIMTVFWDLGSGTTTGSLAPKEIYTIPGDYQVMLIVTDTLGCLDTAYKSVKVLGYSGALTYTPTIGCKPLTVQFTSSASGVPSMIWDFGDGNTVPNSATKLSHQYTAAGKYLPKIIFSDGAGCQSFSDGLDTITVDEAIADFDAEAPCENSTVSFKDKSSAPYSNITNWSWKFADGNTSATQNPNKYYGPTGNYSVKLIVTNGNGCIDSIAKDITIYKNPVVSAGSDTILCINDSVMLVPSGAVSYAWSPPIYLSCTNCENPYASPPVKTYYTVIGTDANGCKDTSQVVLDTKSEVKSEVGDGGEICEGQKILLNATGARTYKWSPGHVLSNDSVGNPEAYPEGTTKFMVIAYEGACKPDTNFIDVIVHPKPQVLAKGDQTIVAGDAADLSVTGDNINRVIWWPSESLNCADCPSTIARPLKTTEYIVTAYSRHNCVDSGSVTVKVLCDQSQVFIPNTFTPNGDGQNDVFYPRGTGIELINSFRIYNRWGEVVFKRDGFATNDISNAWDGTYNGKALPPDVYVYIVEATCDDGEVLQWKGDVTIIR